MAQKAGDAAKTMRSRVQTAGDGGHQVAGGF